MRPARHPTWSAATRVSAGALALLLAACSPAPEARERPPEGLAVGNSAPSLVGRLATNEAFTLREHDGSPVVLVFYRGGFCGLCRVHLERLEQHLGAYRSLGAEVFAVTLDAPAASLELARSARLTVPMVSADSAAFRRWGLLDAGQGGPLPGTFLVDEDGVLLFRHIGRNAADRAADAGVLAALERRGREP